jgi:hypothetical protein
MSRRGAALLSAVSVLAGIMACAPGSRAGTPGTPGTPGATGTATGQDSGQVAAGQSAAAALPGTALPGTALPQGSGSLRQDDISIKLQLNGVAVRLHPMDEEIIRVLSPDSHRAMRDLLETRRAEVERLARVHGLRERRVWLVTFIGLAPDARFSPTDLTITAGGREFRALEVVPLTTGFGEQRLQPREAQRALYLFDDGLDPEQALAAAMGTQRSTEWDTILRAIDRERALIRSRRG